MSTEIEDTVKKLQAHKGVKGVIIFNTEGIPIRTSLAPGPTQNYVAQYSQLVNRVRGLLRDSDPTNEVTFLRIRSKQDEVMISPEKDYMMLVIQLPVCD